MLSTSVVARPSEEPAPQALSQRVDPEASAEAESTLAEPSPCEERKARPEPHFTTPLICEAEIPSGSQPTSCGEAKPLSE